MSAGKRRAAGAVRRTVARPVRTGVQVGGGTLVAQLVDTFVNLTESQTLALAAVLTVFFAWAQNVLEELTGTAVGRDVETDLP